MSISCGDPTRLISVIKTLYPAVEESRPSNLCTKLSFQSGFIVKAILKLSIMYRISSYDGTRFPACA